MSHNHLLARLGHDPWAEAARWAKMPEAAAIDCLAQSIGEMPLGPQALAETFAIASSLVQFLPVQTRIVSHGVCENSWKPAALEWVPMAFLCLSLIFCVLINVISVHAPAAIANAATAAAYIQSNPDGTVADKAPAILPIPSGN